MAWAESYGLVRPAAAQRMDFVEGGRLVDAFRRHVRLVAPVWPGCSASHPATRGQGRIPGGLKLVSFHRFGRADTAGWLGGQAAGVRHAKRCWQLHVAAGGSYGAPIHASIDVDATLE